eukprot:TRINITY_DN15407_c0_g1_i1.p1 TRINITY_DN15407_c0_g1~~TRINITY_DN15407_c0_g1_i1.p1  ORF type:complete len:350 (+),score=71.61 TRINITY_DN15407_c0_g1_i1:150-1052(+)
MAFAHIQKLARLKLQNMTILANSNNNSDGGNSSLPIVWWKAPSDIALFCVVIVTDSGKSLTAAKVINSTWGRYCDKLIFASNHNVSEYIGEDMLLQLEKYPEESSFNLFPKVHQIWRKVYDLYGDSADWFLKADDDSFIIVPNLKHYLWDQWKSDPVTPRFAGRRFKEQGRVDLMFNQGGAGYVLNKPALRKLATCMHANEGYCLYRNGAEDVGIAGCMKYLGIDLVDTQDEFGRERFNAHTLESLFDPNIHSEDRQDWYDSLSLNLEKFEGCCSRQIISFHWLKPEDLRRYFYMFYLVE